MVTEASHGKQQIQGGSTGPRVIKEKIEPWSMWLIGYACPGHRKVPGSILGQALCPDCMFDPMGGSRSMFPCHIDVSLPLPFFSPPPSVLLFLPPSFSLSQINKRTYYSFLIKRFASTPYPIDM